MSDEEDLRFNVLNHELVPKHELLSEQETTAMLQKYSIVKEQLPKIRANDPAVQVVDAKPGQIVKIIRNSPTAGTFTAFRLVVEAL